MAQSNTVGNFGGDLPALSGNPNPAALTVYKQRFDFLLMQGHRIKQTAFEPSIPALDQSMSILWCLVAHVDHEAVWFCAATSSA